MAPSIQLGLKRPPQAWGLERWCSSSERMLFFQKTQVQFPEVLSGSPQPHNSNSKESQHPLCLPWVYTHTRGMHSHINPAQPSPMDFMSIYLSFVICHILYIFFSPKAPMSPTFDVKLLVSRSTYYINEVYICVSVRVFLEIFRS